MSAFRKKKVLCSAPSPGSVTFGDMVISTPKSVVPKGSRTPIVTIETKHVDASEYAKTLQLPNDDDYKLEVMLRNGVVPEEVPVSGVLDSKDPLDLSNRGVADAMFDRLAESVPAEPVSVPAEPVSPASPIPANE